MIRCCLVGIAVVMVPCNAEASIEYKLEGPDAASSIFSAEGMLVFDDVALNQTVITMRELLQWNLEITYVAANVPRYTFTPANSVAVLYWVRPQYFYLELLGEDSFRYLAEVDSDGSPLIYGRNVTAYEAPDIHGEIGNVGDAVYFERDNFRFPSSVFRLTQVPEVSSVIIWSVLALVGFAAAARRS